MRTAQLTQQRGYRVLVTVGLVSYGLVHLAIGWIAIRVALGGRGDTSNQGALEELASQPFGTVLLWIMAVGLLALVPWQVIEAVAGRATEDTPDMIKRRARAVGRAVVYLALAVSSAAIAIGAGSGSGNPEESLTGRLLALPFGRALVAVVGLVVLGVGIGQIVKGVKQKFTEDLRAGVSRPVLALGTAGYIAKGVALGIVGVLFGWATISYDADKAGGLDAALAALRSQPFGSVLLLAMAAGFAAFGVFCFVWAKNPRV